MNAVLRAAPDAVMLSKRFDDTLPQSLGCSCWGKLVVSLDQLPRFWMKFHTILCLPS